MADTFGFTVHADDKTQGAFNSALKRMEGFGSKAKSLLTAPFRALGSMQLFAFAQNVGSLYRTLEGLVNLNAESARNAAKLSATLKATGYAAGYSSRELQEYAGALQKATTFDDDAIVEGMSVLATFSQVQGDVFKDAIALGMDMATITGQDLTGAYTMLGKALNDPTRGLTALTRVGVVFSEQQRQQIAACMAVNDVVGAQKVMLNELRHEYGGTAEAVAKTAGGALKQMKNALGNLGESFGQALDPFITKASGKVKEWAEGMTAYLQSHMGTFQKIISTSLGGAAEGIGGGLKGAFSSLTAAFKGGDVKGIISSLAGTLAKLPIQITQAALKLEQAALKLGTVLSTAFGNLFKSLAGLGEWKIDDEYVFGPKFTDSMLDAWEATERFGDESNRQAVHLDATLEKLKTRLGEIEAEADKLRTGDPLAKMADAAAAAVETIRARFGSLQGGLARVFAPLAQHFAKIKEEGKLAGEALQGALGKAADKLLAATEKLLGAQRALQGFKDQTGERRYQIALANAGSEHERRNIQLQRAQELQKSAGTETDTERKKALLEQSMGMWMGFATDKTMMRDKRSREFIMGGLGSTESALQGMAEGDVTAARGEAGAAAAEKSRIEGELASQRAKEQWAVLSGIAGGASSELGRFKKAVVEVAGELVKLRGTARTSGGAGNGIISSWFGAGRAILLAETAALGE